MMMDRDEQDIKRAFESIETPEYDIASAVLQEKNNRCEVVPLRKVAVMAVSLLVVVSLVSVIAITNLSQGKWVDPGSSVLPLAGNDMERDETSEGASSLAIEPSLDSESSLVDESSESEELLQQQQQEEEQKQWDEIRSQMQENEICFIYNTNQHICAGGYGSGNFYELKDAQEYYSYLNSASVSLQPPSLPEEYQFKNGSVSYDVTESDILKDTLHISETDDFVAFYYQTSEPEISGDNMQAEFSSEVGKFIRISTNLETSSYFEGSQYWEGNENFELIHVIDDNEGLFTSIDFYKKLASPIEVETFQFWNFCDAEYEQYSGIACTESYPSDIVQKSEYLRIHIEATTLSKDEIIAIAQSMLENVQ
ncbi:hypothetical protein NIF40_03765 [[Clostridium] leptum]|uniref:DUF4367 domain-containing protein n=1 Tax=Solibaculum mannosilyticum TaxID=2780922 RepID=A0A7I8D508_9FIRM|nr:hypothetical protein [Solibaculum mannosilyticum]MCO7136643.1 hypothetical protein [[Clostridium] leptum]BCI61115.1 hypothetical protein C12CBH8_17540 [Solibaculum mannosilyticum]